MIWPMLTRDLFPLLILLFVLVVLVIANNVDRWALAVYALSFWHYPVYALAFLWRKVPHERFIRDSVMLKGISLATFCLILWVTVPNIPAILVMAVGFTFNMTAARALGSARTYYGYELGGLPPERITSFPYSLSWVRHPMLAGNMLAYAGVLLDDSFRQDWWPLAVLHVLLNFASMLTEIYGKEDRTAGWTWIIASLVIGTALLFLGFWEIWPFALITAIFGVLFGIVIIRRYA